MENKFVWTEDLVKELLGTIECMNSPFTPTGINITISEFKQSKQKKYPEGIIQFERVDEHGFIFQTYELTDPRLTYQQFCDKAFAENYKIRSAQGINEPVSVGDFVKYKTFNTLAKPWKIRQIIINQHNLLVAQGYDVECELVSQLEKGPTEKTYTVSEVQKMFKKFFESIPV